MTTGERVAFPLDGIYLIVVMCKGGPRETNFLNTEVTNIIGRG